jgi:hypothetical protein
MTSIDIDEIRNKKSKSFFDVVTGTAAFFYYVSPLGYFLDYDRHNLAIEMFKAV